MLESTSASSSKHASLAGRRNRGEREQLERLSTALNAATRSARESERDVIRTQVLEGARSGLAKVNQGEAVHRFTLGEQIGLEAVVLTNGERPSLLVRDGFIDLTAPDIGEWDVELGRVQSKIRKVIASVGRINVPTKARLAGSCFAIAEGLVVTNRHVLEEIATEDPAGSWTLKFADATTVDFIGEIGTTRATKFKVTDVAFAGPHPIKKTINFAHLDMAVLRLDPASDRSCKFPAGVVFESDMLQPKVHRDLYVVGFPGKPLKWAFGGAPMAGHETAWVMSKLFNNKFGKKRLAPGRVKIPAGEVANDASKWICAHDASTLGGNSGSCVVDLGGDGLRVVALHFAGVSRAQNWAHVTARLREQLSKFSKDFL